MITRPQDTIETDPNTTVLQDSKRERDHAGPAPKHSDVILTSDEEMFVSGYGQLEAMMSWQSDLSNVLGVKLNDVGQVRDIVACLAVEAAEAQAHFLNATKPWKSQEVDFDEVDEEMIDAFHFLLSYFNLRGMSSYDVLVEYRQKNLKNYSRIQAKMAVHQTETEGSGDA